jgi:DHA2 family multidrug resistance protein
VLGGWLTDAYGWPWIFYINIPIGIFSMALVLGFLPESAYLQRGLARIDVTGIILLVVGLTAMQIFFEQGDRRDWFESGFMVIIALVALVTLTALVVWELRVEEPVINFRVLNNLAFVGGVTIGLIFGLTTFGSIFMLPLFLQQLQGHSVLDSGLIQMPRMLIVLFVAPIAGRVYGKFDNRLLAAIGTAIMMAGYLDMSRFTLEVGWVRMLPGLLLTGAGMAFLFSVLSAATMRTMPPALLTAAAGLFTLSRRIGGNIGYAFVANQIAHRSIFHHARLADHLTPYDTGTVQTMDGLTGQLASSGLPPGVAEGQCLKTPRRHRDPPGDDDGLQRCVLDDGDDVCALLSVSALTRRPHPTPGYRYGLRTRFRPASIIVWYDHSVRIGLIQVCIQTKSQQREQSCSGKASFTATLSCLTKGSNSRRACALP